MKIYLKFCLFFVLFCTSLFRVKAENSVNIMGYTAAKYSVYSDNIEPVLADGQKGKVSNTFSMFQTNLFFTKNVNENLKFFGELMFQNDVTNQLNIGQSILHQAWGEYSFGPKLNVRFGSMISPYGGFNILHSRPPLYHFVERPFAYEEPILTDGLVNLRPEFSNLAFLGKTNISDDYKFDYALYIGNTYNTFSNGWDLSSKKQMGARFAITSDNFQIGFSPATNVLENVDSTATSNKTLLAIDFKVNISDFSIYGEYINSSENFEQRSKDIDFTEKNYTKAKQQAMYVAAAYNFSEKTLMYVSYDYFSNDASNSKFKDNPLTRARIGANYSPIDDFIIKAEVNAYLSEFTGYKKYQSASLAAVVIF